MCMYCNSEAELIDGTAQCQDCGTDYGDGWPDAIIDTPPTSTTWTTPTGRGHDCPYCGAEDENANNGYCRQCGGGF